MDKGTCHSHISLTSSPPRAGPRRQPTGILSAGTVRNLSGQRVVGRGPHSGAPRETPELLPASVPLGGGAGSEGPSSAARGAPLAVAVLAALDGLVLMGGKECHVCIID